MKSTKPLVILSLVIVVLAALALWLSERAKPGMDSKRPLILVPVGEISRVMIQKPTETIELEKTETGWLMKQPLIDSADMDTIDRFLGSMTSFTVGSLVSEKSERHATFAIQDASSTRVTLYGKSKEKPVLDAHIGKQAIGYTSSYYRPANQDKVYIADNLPNWLIAQSMSDYRNRDLLPFQGEANGITVRADKSVWTLSRSSRTWSIAGSTSPADAAWVQTLFDKVGALRAEDFVSDLDPASRSAFDKPYMEVEIQSSSGTVKAALGGKAKNRAAPEVEHIYGRSEGRPTLLMVLKRPVDEVLSHLKSR